MLNVMKWPMPGRVFSIRENFLGVGRKFFVIGERDEEMVGRIFE